ncbi:MAG: hypothetical protein JSV49_06130, partial [Thermoplasmata archaeon]
ICSKCILEVSDDVIIKAFPFFLAPVFLFIIAYFITYDIVVGLVVGIIAGLFPIIYGIQLFNKSADAASKLAVGLN